MPVATLIPDHAITAGLEVVPRATYTSSFGHQNWGETLARYARSVKRFSGAKLEEIIRAALTLYCATGKGRTAIQGGIKGKSIMEDTTDIQGQILPSSDIELSAGEDDEGDSEQEMSEGDEDMMGEYLSLIQG